MGRPVMEILQEFAGVFVCVGAALLVLILILAWLMA